MNLYPMIATVSVLALSSSAFGKVPTKDKELNCEVGTSKLHVDDEKACSAKKGTWIPATPHTNVQPQGAVKASEASKTVPGSAVPGDKK